MISNCRALDLTDFRCWHAGKILAELGCEVIKIEPPGGDPGRRLGPFYGGKPDPQKSLTWFAYNTSKKGITLNIETHDGRELLKKLVANTDFIIESFHPGYLDELGIGYAALSELNPRLILTSITAFGQDGPYRDYKGAHIVLMALSSLMYVTGDSDRPPLQTGIPMPYMQASGQGASATLVAYYARERDGKGQHVDVAMHHSSAMVTMNAVPVWQLEKVNLSRAGQLREGRTITGANPRYIWPCKDGWLTFSIGGGPVYIRSLQSLVEWMSGEDMVDDFLKNHDWTSFDMAKITPTLLQQVEEPIARFFQAHTKAELFAGAIKRGIILFPVSSPKDIAVDQQLLSRQFWTNVEYKELGASIPHAGYFAKTTGTPFSVKHRAPFTGEHNEEIYCGELGLSREELAMLGQAGIV
ncbi:CaiB/BaiF CoA transferase family protein [Chloroflexota bacterium]